MSMSEKIAISGETSSRMQSREVTGAAQSLGQVVVPSILCGAAGVLFAVILHFLAIYEGVDGSLKRWFESQNILYIITLEASLLALTVVAGVLAFAIAFFCLGSAFFWRRCVLGVAGLAVIIGGVVSCALWGVHLPAAMIFFSYVWSWLCASIYASQHVMPAEEVYLFDESDENLTIEEDEPAPGVVISIQQASEEAVQSENPESLAKVDEQTLYAPNDNK